MINLKSRIYKLWLSFVVFLGVSIAPQVASSQGTTKVSNPLAADDVGAFLADLVSMITTLAVPVIVVMIIVTGFLFVTAGGDQDQLDRAKRNALYVAIGSAVILGAELIVTVLENTASGLGVEGLN